MSKQIKVGVIRKAIRACAWVRNDFSGINSERVKQPVGPTLTAKIAELQALAIPAHRVDLIEERDEEIARCRRVIARWEALVAAEPKASNVIAFNPPFNAVQLAAREVAGEFDFAHIWPGV